MEKSTTLNAIDVPSVDDFLQKTIKADGKALKEKTAIPRIRYFAYCADTEGNVFRIMEEDKTAH